MRVDLLKNNGEIFVDTGKAINDNSSRDIKVVVVGNPVNTNCLILANHAHDINRDNFTALSRLDHNRGLSYISHKLDVDKHRIDRFSVWGNHSPSMVPFVHNIHIDGEHVTFDEKWEKDLIHNIACRADNILKTMGKDSAASAGQATIDHIKDWVLGSDNEIVSMGVHTEGNPYGIPDGLIFSFPVRTENGKYTIVNDCHMQDFYK